MSKRPPPAIRYLVLMGAVALLATAVCTKSDKASEPEVPVPPVQVMDAAPAAPEEVILDAAAAELPAEQSQEQAPNPPQTAPNKKNAAPNKKNTNPPKEKEFFPASKSGGMF